MKPNVFMSYSRREVPFVNNLVDDLEDNGYEVWLDYRSLIPGTPWAGQIDKGIADSEVIVLVVSKAAMASEYVELEWKNVLKLGKRVILVIFEAVDLPEELECFEWVDFRGKYEDGLEELMRQLDQPEDEDHPAPKTGFKVPKIVWWAAALSVIVAIFSLGAFWTLLVPFILLPLPFRVFRRDFNFTQVQGALVLLPFALFMSGAISEYEDTMMLSFGLALGCLPFVIGLIFVLRSPGMQRWGKPMATLPIFANPYNPNNPNPEPISFFVDHAPEDRVAADDLKKALSKYGHPQAEELSQAEAVFVLISHYNKYTEADPQHQVVYPILLQATDDIHEKLSKVQWIDFQRGLRNLDEIAQLLPSPAKLLKALGIRPMGRQLVLPPVIQYLTYFLIFLILFTAGSWIPFIYQFIFDIADYADADWSLVQLGISLGLFITLSIFMLRAVIGRRGRLAWLPVFLLAMVGLGIIVGWQYFLGDNIMEVFGVFDYNDDFRGLSASIPPILYLLGNVLMTGFSIWKRDDIRRWFPARNRGESSIAPKG
jgi:hypothetical protein